MTAEEITPVWLAHHFPEDYDRCVVVGRRHVCRRCIALYPVTFAVMVLSVVGLHWPSSWDSWLLIALPIPGVVEFVLEQVGVVSYNPRRLVLVTVPLAIALGQGFARYLESPGDTLFWGIVLGYGFVCGLSVLWRWTRR